MWTDKCLILNASTWQTDLRHPEGDTTRYAPKLNLQHSSVLLQDSAGLKHKSPVDTLFLRTSRAHPDNG